MFEALVVTLREGVEAALVVGIIVAFLRREGYERHLGAVWAGIGTATAASLAGAWLLYRWAVNEEAFEGILYLGSALIVGSMMIWMWRHSHTISGEMKGSLAKILARGDGDDGGDSRSVGLGLFLFTFLMVFREGIETVLFLSALSLTTNGLLAILGVLIGLSAAVVFGVLFVRGSLRVDLGRFFKITGIALGIFVLQLLINGYHELSEAGWLPANQTTMATIGPLVQNEFFFIAAVLALPLLMLLIPGRKKEAAPAVEEGAAARLARAQSQRQARSRTVGAVLGLIILAVLGMGFVYAQPPVTLSPATPVQLVDGAVRIPLATFKDMRLQRFQVTVEGQPVRFIAVPVDDKGDIATAFDSCLICGPRGYYQEGTTVTCLHCGSAIYPPSIGQSGGCNPVPLKSRVEAGQLVLAANDLASGANLFQASGSHAGHTMGTGN
ncbi:MAG TPA: Fe-S-containing protein [Thermoanaerobaculia bacterium]|jgi:FTR1 family protein|nr:Fe-S-containing protein [Thermoanaerobaculia bacterium]